MARSERRSTTAAWLNATARTKSHHTKVHHMPETLDVDDIFEELSCDDWRRRGSAGCCYSGCCLKEGRVRCACTLPSLPRTKMASTGWHGASSDTGLRLLNSCGVPGGRRARAQVRTVSIIDTLSELAGEEVAQPRGRLQHRRVNGQHGLDALHSVSQNEEDAFRLCFSDSEVRDNDSRPSISHSSHLFPRARPDPVLFRRGRSRDSVPDWIREVFDAAKKGDVDRMKYHLKDLDPGLVRNLSDESGNNLWHVCAVHDNFECLGWLCAVPRRKHAEEALADLNKNGFSPVALAVKHGSLVAVQWLLQHTSSSKEQLVSRDGQTSRPLLHVAARYGQSGVLEWLLGHMSSLGMDAAVVDGERNTALHLASKHGHVACVKALVLQAGCLKARNERGLTALELAVRHHRTECVDYLVATEACHSLAAAHIKQRDEIRRLQKENIELKSFFKELLTLAKRLQHRQQELIQSFSQIHPNNDRLNSSSSGNLHFEDYSQLLAEVVADEDRHLRLIEDQWRKCRRHYTPNHTTSLAEGGELSKRSPTDIVRSQIKHVLDRVAWQSPPVPSTPETSDDSWHSGEEETKPPLASPPRFTTPDVVHSLMSPKEDLKQVPPINPAPCKASRGVNLRLLFKQNPNLRQSGETCSVLEVLEPSSSDSEEGARRKRRASRSRHSPHHSGEAEQSSSSSALDTLGPYSSCRPSSSGSKASGSRSSSSGSRQNPFSTATTTTVSAAVATSGQASCENNPPSNITAKDGGATDQLCSEPPDLIRGTQKKIDGDECSSRDMSLSCDGPNSFERIEPQTLNRSFLPDTPAQDSASQGSKRRGFLLKFSLRGRWAAKAPAVKKEISPEEFRETYSRTEPVASSHIPVRKEEYEAEGKGPEAYPMVPSEGAPPNLRRGLLPPRRDPPPAPPHFDDEGVDKSEVSTPTPHSYGVWDGSGSTLNGGLSSASTEILLPALDSSTTGRQSPAPSEVSKTESALSPPSDVSKTESARYLGQLGRIGEEGGVGGTAFLASITACPRREEEPLKPEDPKLKKNKRKSNMDKPWYEFSDEEDVITPQRYQGVSVGMRSSSDEEVGTAATT